MNSLWKIIGLSVLAVVVILAIIKVVIILIKVVSFLLAVLAFMVPVAIIYGIYYWFRKK